MDFAQIRLRSVENMMGFAQIRRNSDGICSNPTTIWCIFAQILWVLQKSGDDLMFFCLDLVIFAQIRRRSDEKYNRRQNGISGSIIVGFDRSDRQSKNFDPTWPVGVCGRRRVFLLETRCHRVGSGLGTNPTRTDPWTPLVTKDFDRGCPYCFSNKIKKDFFFN